MEREPPSPEKSEAVGLRRAKQRKRAADHRPRTSQPETFAGSLATETQALEVSSRDRTRVASVETA